MPKFTSRLVKKLRVYPPRAPAVPTEVRMVAAGTTKRKPHKKTARGK